MNFQTRFCLALVLFSLRASHGEMLSAADRTYLVAHLEMTREFVIDTTRGLTKQQWMFKPQPLRWSIAQCIDHLAQTEAYVLKTMRERVLISEEPLTGKVVPVVKTIFRRQ